MSVLRVLAVLALSIAMVAGVSPAGAQKGGDTGQSLIGTWQSESGQSDDVTITFRDDGTAFISEGSGDPGMTVRYQTDWSASPARILWDIEGSRRVSLVEFIDGDRLRVTEPSSNPQNFEDEDPLIFVRSGGGIGPAGPTVPALTEEFLIGVWSEAGERQCEDEIFLFYDIGILVAVEEDEEFEGAGMWRLEGDRLLLTIVEGDSPTMATAEEVSGTVSVLSANSFEIVIEQFDDRSTLVRCSGHGEAEAPR